MEDAIMLAGRENEEWSLKPHKERDYETEAERRFFAAVEEPKPAPEELRQLYRDFGKYLKAKP